MAGRLDKADVVALLSPERVLDSFGIEHHRSGSQIRTQHCPACGQRSRDAVTISASDGRWRCHAHECKGDLLAMVAGYASLDVERDFTRVLELAADIAGVLALPGRDEELAQRRAAAAARGAAERAAAEAARARAEGGAGAIWDRLARQSDAGAAYLRERRLERAAGEVRYGRHSICLPLFDGSGTIRNVVGRRFDGGEPKVRGLASCSTLGTFGDPGRLRSTIGDLVVVEGVADYLSARVLWPERLTLGAHGAGRIPDVGELAGRLAAPAKRGVLFVPHNDDVGGRQVDRGIVAAIKAGMAIEDIEVYVLEPEWKDLNDYLRAKGSR